LYAENVLVKYKSRRDSSVVEHFHGKEGVPGSSPGHGSKRMLF
jgi:hypothetical protein